MRRVKKILNDPAKVVEETLEGMNLAGDGATRLLPGNIIVADREKTDKPALLIGGGSGHEPMFAGYVGPGLADGAVCGQVFAAPSPDAIVAATKAVDCGKGVLYVYGNYSGDNMNFDIGAELADEDENIATRTVRVRDDVAAAPVERMDDRRGIAGDFFVIKVAGAASEAVDTLEELHRIAAKAEANTRSIGIAVSAGSIPETGEPTFELGEDEIEIGMGAHGEPGAKRQKLAPADEIVDQMMDLLLADLPFKKGDEVALLINNLGSSTPMELFVANRRVRARLADAGITVHRTEVGPFITSQEMAGYSITLMRLDDELKGYLDAPASSLAYSN
ncbi:dihydroxyacetone kinase-like protein [Rhodobium orientis]|uniref:Dihydroxyacetone kinase n=1 Tax=Rhodobium orientis TaxID=34017 RepID=A0A327JPE2_9HYPH|nr:dihydroxyacetone kinase subunit DhaK [Rhodobium orientis]MBB4301718.1 dihydroxyacetone kinase-like protein [Rhodobium orientis]MBK5950521.1 dihydroxyacetone kinase [Rhodobium orientis]RAI28167.1 dihydroxyacetone kinase [Rhodobium orientis]